MKNSKNETARCDVPGMTGSMSTPKPTQAKGRTSVVSVKHGSSAAGVIKSGSDKHSYLGHFRSPKNLKAGHNVGAPGFKTTPVGGAPGGPLRKTPPKIADGGGTFKPPGTPSLEGGGGFKTPPAPKKAITAGSGKAWTPNTGGKLAATPKAGVNGLAGLQAATANVKSTRQAMRQTMRGGAGKKPMKKGLYL